MYRDLFTSACDSDSSNVPSDKFQEDEATLTIHPSVVSNSLPDATSNTAPLSRSRVLRLPSQNDGSVELVKAKSSQMLQSRLKADMGDVESHVVMVMAELALKHYCDPADATRSWT